MPGECGSEHRPLRASVQGSREPLRACADRAKASGSATGWTGTALTPIGRSARTTEVVLHDERREQLHHLVISEEAHHKNSIYRGYDVMPWCALRRRPFRTGDEGRLQAGGAPRVLREVPAQGTREGKLARVDDNAVDANEQRQRGDQPGTHITFKVDSSRAKSITLRRGAFKLNRMEGGSERW